MPRSPYVYAISAVLLWSTVASAFKISLRYLSPLELLFYSSIVSLGALSLLLAFDGGFSFLWEMDKRDWSRYALMGLLNPFLYYVVLFKAYDILPAQEAQPLNYTWQIVLSVMAAIVFKQKVRGRTWVGIGIAFSGVVLISSRGEFAISQPMGVALALGSALIWASFWILNMKDQRGPVQKLFLSFLFGSLYVGIALSVYGIFLSPPSIPSVYGLMGAIYVGLFEMGLTFVLWLKALESAENTASISLMIYLSPFLSFIMIHFIVGEEILLSTILGTALIISGIFMDNLGVLRRSGKGENGVGS